MDPSGVSRLHAVPKRYRDVLQSIEQLAFSGGYATRMLEQDPRSVLPITREVIAEKVMDATLLICTLPASYQPLLRHYATHWFETGKLHYDMQYGHSKH